MLQNVLLLLAALVVLLLAYAAIRPSAFRVARSAHMKAPPAAVFAQVNDFDAWQHWSPWAKLDPNAKAEFSGPRSGIGAGFAWDGNRNVGKGRMTIVESRPSDLIRIRLDFEKPMAGTNEAQFTFEPESGGTRVTWAMTGTSNFVSRLVCTFVSMDKMVGGQFEKGLASITQIVEGKAG